MFLWKPLYGDIYYCPDITQDTFVFQFTWYNREDDEHRYKAGLIFKDRIKAIEQGKKIYYNTWYRNIIKVQPEIKSKRLIDILGGVHIFEKYIMDE